MFTRKPVTQQNRQTADERSNGSGLSLPAIPALQKMAGGDLPVDKTVLQPKLKSQNNPYLAAKNIPLTDSGKERVDQDAQYMSAETDTTKAALESLVDKYNKGDDITTEMDVIDARAGGQKNNLTNRLIEWKRSKGDPTKSSNLKMCLGYIVECYIQTIAATRTGVNLQVKMGGARPDFQVMTGEAWQHDGNNYDANGLIDITSANEANKGHISEKMTRAKDSDAINHPHLYDVYYDTMQLPGAVNDLTTDQAKTENALALEQRYKDLMLAREKTKASLRTKEERDKGRDRDAWKNRDDKESKVKDRTPSRDSDRRKRKSDDSRERSRSMDKRVKAMVKMKEKEKSGKRK